MKVSTIAIGALGGVAGALLMGEVGNVTSKAVRAKPAGGRDATEIVADAAAKTVTGERLRYSERKAGGQIVHYAFGATIGACYALWAERVPVVTTGGGLLFGAAAYAGAHAAAVPALGLARGPLENGLQRESAELSAHIAYGVTTETVRRLFAN